MNSRVVYKNHRIYFDVDGKIIDSLAFKSFRPTYKNVGEFYDAGVRIFHVYCSGLPSGLKVPYSLFGEVWTGDHQYNFDNLDNQIDFFKKNAPEGYVFINVHLDTRDWWLKENPGNPNSFTHLSQIACNEKWKKDTSDYLKALIKHTEEKYNDFVIGYFILGGYTTEWFSEFDHEESHPNKLAAYRKYLNNNNIDIPGKDILEMPKEEIFLKNNKEEIISYRKFHNNLIADTVLYFAKEAQEVLKHTKIFGLFFGYILELLYQRLWEAAHLEFDKVIASNDIDLIATPSSYQFRGYEDNGAFMLLCDSLEKHRKACFISFDHTTFLLPTLADNPKRVCGDPDTDIALKLLAEMRSRNKKDLLATREQTIQTMRREYMQRIIKRVGYWWFDMFEGWFYDDALMDEIKHEIDISKKYIDVDTRSISEVAVFVSGQSLYHVSKNSELNTEIICNQRGGLARMGAPYDIYSLSDLDTVDISQYKLFIFIGAFELTEKQEKYINLLKNASKTLFFIGAPNYSIKGIDGSNDILEFKLKTINSLENKVVGDGFEFGYENPKKDRIAIDDKSVSILGIYKESKEVCFGYKKCNNGYLIYSGIGNLNYLAFHEVLKLAGVHIYVNDAQGLFVCKHFLGVYSPLVKKTTISLLEDGTYYEIFTNKQYKSKNKKIVLDTSKDVAQMLYKD